MKKQAKGKRRKLPALDKYVIFSLSCIILFTITIIVLFATTGDEPTALVTCFFACMGGELLSLALIKRLKLKREAQDEQSNIDNMDSFG